MLRTEVLSGESLFDTRQGQWRDLIGDAPTATPFQSLEWHRTWWKHYGGVRRPLAVAVFEGADLVGIMPFFRTRGPWRTLRPMGVGPSDYLHPLARRGYEDAVAEEVAHCARTLKGVDLIDLHQVRETRALAQAFPATRIEQATCLLLDLPKTYEAYLQTLSKSLRYDVRKLDKSLFSTGRARIDPVPADRIDWGMDVLFEQHKLRWRKRGLPGAFLGKAIRFHKEWATEAAKNGWLWLSILSLDEQPIGAIYAMVAGDTAFYYQAGFDPEKGAVSPGTLLVAFTIRRAIEEGMSHFDFMRGDEPYKRRWKPQHVHRNLRLIAPANGLMGSLGSSWNQAGSRVETRVRARLEGRGLI
ncbi:MAG: GNAT family N-acetyltransferase [Fimbriimonas sp.]|nr:GNAT family N-acetyltransferase [Fimbriimonas sp.]